MGRYSEIQTELNDSNQRIYKMNVYPSIPLHESDIYVECTVGDRLDLLANQFYNDVNLYWIILSANPDVNRGSICMKPGTILRIPTDVSRILEDYNSKNK